MQLYPPGAAAVSPLAFLGRDLAIDLGTATTQIYAPGLGVVLNEPSMAAACAATGRTLFGADAYAACSPSSGAGMRAVRHDDGIARWPVREGGELAGRLVKHFLSKVHGHPYARPRLVMALPDGAPPILSSAVRDLAYEADARRVYLVEHAVAVALGAGLPVTELGRAHDRRHRPSPDQDRDPRLRRRRRRGDRPRRRRRRERGDRHPGRP
ncbi:rod shape-determining protein [Nonomuraea ferruginea]